MNSRLSLAAILGSLGFNLSETMPELQLGVKRGRAGKHKTASRCFTNAKRKRRAARDVARESNRVRRRIERGISPR